jgi:hypothetical protein
MASTSNPFGFRPSFHPSGQIRAKAYTIASGYAANIFMRDPVKLVNTGTIQLATSDGTRTGTVDGIKVVGIFAGVEYIDALGKPTWSNYWPTGITATNIVAWVYDDPEMEFDVQYTNPGTPGTDSVQTYVGRQCDWVQTAAGGSTSTGLSATYLTAVQATSGQFQIVAFSRAIGDALTDAYVTATVRINEHQYKASVNTVS